MILHTYHTYLSTDHSQCEKDMLYIDISDHTDPYRIKYKSYMIMIWYDMYQYATILTPSDNWIAHDDANQTHLDGCGWPNSWVQNSNRFISIFPKSTAWEKYEKSNDKTAFVSCMDGWLNPSYRITCCGKMSLSVWNPSAQLVPLHFACCTQNSGPVVF